MYALRPHRGRSIAWLAQCGFFFVRQGMARGAFQSTPDAEAGRNPRRGTNGHDLADDDQFGLHSARVDLTHLVAPNIAVSWSSRGSSTRRMGPGRAANRNGWPRCVRSDKPRGRPESASGQCNCTMPAPFILHPSSFILHPSSFIPHPSSLIPHPSSLIPHQLSGTHGTARRARTGCPR
jgi:hypothetical protein